MSWLSGHVSAWDTQYNDGRYVGDPPEPFADTVLAAASRAGVARGLYVGCGNGRNFFHLVDQGLDLRGVDISSEAIRQVTASRPEMADRFTVGTIDAIPSKETFELVIGIQVFMFGTRAQTHTHLAAAMSRVEPGGLLCLRANAVGTDVWPSHHVSEVHADESFTVVYESGPKSGLSVHFLSWREPADIFAGWLPVYGPDIDARKRNHGPGQWSQFEAIYQRPA